jgi:hypothetical protein
MIHESEYGLDPQGRVRYYGIYRAIVISNSDPLNKYKLKVQIPQILGTETTNWIPAVLPVTYLSSQVAASLTTSATSISVPDESSSLTVNIPALTVTSKTTPVLPMIPTVGQHIWVMFIAGDPEYPVWIGIEP